MFTIKSARNIGLVSMPLRQLSSQISAAAAKGSPIFDRLKPGPLKKLYKYYTPEAINFAGGVPMDSIFPINSIKISDGKEEFEVSRAKSSLMLNYHRGNGIPVLRDWIQAHASSLHHRKGDFDTCMSVGSTDAFAKVLMLLKGDTVIFDEYAYGAAVGASTSLGRTNIGIKMDEHGMLPDELRRQVLIARANGLNPDVVYLVPEAQNPTGKSMSQQRKRDIYNVCKELDLVIIEDDAYYYITFGRENEELPGIKNLPRSIFSLDTEGRVLRLDSLSKFVAPGMRLGWIAGPEDFITKYNLLQEMTSQFPAGLSQSVFAGLVSHWGEEGLDKHVREMQLHYKNQCKAILAALRTNVPDHIMDYNTPTGGMFLWASFEKNSNFRGVSSHDLFVKLAGKGIIAVPGDEFFVPSLGSDGKPFSSKKQFPSLRLSFAAPSVSAINEGTARLGAALS